MIDSTDNTETRAKGSTFLRVAYARLLQEAQKSLKNQLRKNPHRPRRLSLAGRARVGVRTHGFFCRRHKSNSSGRSFGSGVMASRVPFAGRSPRPSSMNDHDTTAVASAPDDRLSSNIHRQYQGYQGNFPLRANTGESARARERPHGCLFYFDILDMLNNNIRKNGGRV
jgi:hypothetical protein